MSSFDDRTDQLLRLIGTPASNVDSKQGDRVFNYVFPPTKWQEMQRELVKIQNGLKRGGFDPVEASFAKICLEVFEDDPMFAMQVEMEAVGDFTHAECNDDLLPILAGSESTISAESSPVDRKLLERIDQAAQEAHGVLLLVDTIALFPLFRISAFEQRLQGRFKVPTVIFYPGERGSSGSNPSFLGILPSDGNYRSNHIY